MNPAKSAFFLLVFLIVMAITALVAIPARSEPNQFIIQNADDSSTSTLVGSSGLETLISNILPRFVITSADENIFRKLVPAPVELVTLIGQIPSRFVLSYANENRFLLLNYPLELIDDSTPPLVSQVDAGVSGEDTAKITWTTNEFTTSLVEYGSQSGVYSDSITDNQYRKTHEAVIGGISPSVTYYYQITSIDRSGNSTQSAEYSFAIKPTQPLFLPMIVR